jgi:cellulose synthase/poly-beta-1,6-N-acetylglucosamine synthase-like glycosyltransferase
MLQDLPQSPPGKTGWPWTTESQSFPPLTPASKPWPKISIVTPSYNQGTFLEETIRSVLLQNYPNCEYIIIDGGSTDNSIEVIKRYEKWLSYWISEKDRGQIDAINKGFERSTGEILAWINSDDLYLMNALAKIALYFTKDVRTELLIGERLNIDSSGSLINKQTLGPNTVIRSHVLYFGRWPFYQECVFFKKRLWNKAGPLSEEFSLLFDQDFFFRCLRFVKANTIPGTLIGCWRHHYAQKINDSRTDEIAKEIGKILDSHGRVHFPQWVLNVLWSLGKWTVRRGDKVVPLCGHSGSVGTVSS